MNTSRRRLSLNGAGKCRTQSGVTDRTSQKCGPAQTLREKHEGKRLLGRPKGKSDLPVMDVKEIGWEDSDWIDVAQEGSK